MMASPTVFIVDDEARVLDGLKWLVESIDLPVKTYASAEEFLGGFEPARPGCLLLDVRMPGMGGMRLLDELEQREIGLPAIILTGHANVAMTVRAMKAGAIDVIEKPFDDQLLLDRIQDAIELDAERRKELIAMEAVGDRLESLTQREREIFDLMVQGQAVKQIAHELEISRRTAEVHRSHVMNKMNAESIAELVRMALAAKPV